MSSHCTVRFNRFFYVNIIDRKREAERRNGLLIFAKKSIMALYHWFLSQKRCVHNTSLDITMSVKELQPLNQQQKVFSPWICTLGLGALSTAENIFRMKLICGWEKWDWHSRCSPHDCSKYVLILFPFSVEILSHSRI